jgi:hypothetical protein
MNKKPLISTQVFCSNYNIKISFVDALNKMGLI